MKFQRDGATADEDVCAATTESLLRRSLLGEYIALVLMMHAILGAFAWAAWSFREPAGSAVVAAGLWVTIRATGLLVRHVVLPFVTVGFLSTILLFQQQLSDAVAHLWIFSPTVFAVMLSAVLCLDLVELAMSPLANNVLGRIRRWNWHRIAVWAFVFVFLAYVVLFPLASSYTEAILSEDKGPPADDELTLGAKIGLRTMEGVTASVFFALGATIGSFLNVVVYRMPRGESVVFRPSSCPRCETKINGRDNVPVLGWLLLNGRCRACQIPISSRYPIVELVSGALFALLYFVELISGGENLPVRRPNFYNGVVWIIFYTKWDLVGLYVFHCFTLCTLLTWALVDVDRQRIPWWAKWCVGGILFFLPSVFPDLLLVPWLRETAIGPDVPDWGTMVATSVFGGVVGALLGWVGVVVTRASESVLSETDSEDHTGTSMPRGHIVSASVIVGLSVGWQAAIGVWLMTLALKPAVDFVAGRCKRGALPLSVVLLVGYLSHLVCWRLLSTSWWPSHLTTPTFWGVWFVTFGLLCLACRVLTPSMLIGATLRAESTSAD